MRRTIVAGNWKMNMNLEEAVQLATGVARLTAGVEAEVVVCPAYVCLTAVRDAIQGTSLVLGAQDVHWEPKGAYTGKVSCDMLRSAGVQYVIIGHSEQRTYFHETNETVSARSRQRSPLTCCRSSAWAKPSSSGKQARPRRCSEITSPARIEG